jgi:hypothetical protein
LRRIGLRPAMTRDSIAGSVSGPIVSDTP